MRRTVNFANGLSLTIALGCAACSGDDPDPGRDAEPELPDAGLDAAVEQELDASPDASPDAAVDDALDPALVADLEEALGVAIEEAGTDSAIAAVELGERRWIGAAGRDGLAPTDVFRIGSITKTFVAVLVLGLAREGALSLDDTLDLWFPTVPHADAITIHQLLQHTSGVFDYTRSDAFDAALRDDPHRELTIDDLLAFVLAEEPAFLPGEDWDYSNTGFVLLGAILETVTGRSIAELLHERIGDPLGMRSTAYEPEEPVVGTMAVGWSNFFTGFLDPMQDQYSASWAGAAGGIVSSAADLLLFGRALDEGTLLDADDTAAMHETVDTHGAGYRYGLGLMELEGVDVPIYGHGGDIWGYHSALLRFPDSDATLVLLVNRDGADITPLIVELGEAAGLL